MEHDMMKVIRYVAFSVIFYSGVCFASQPCPEGTRPSLSYTVLPALFIIFVGTGLIVFFQKTIRSKLIKIVLQLIVGMGSVVSSIFVFGFMNMIAPCV